MNVKSELTALGTCTKLTKTESGLGDDVYMYNICMTYAVCAMHM